jgi:hypothetical protein
MKNLRDMRGSIFHSARPVWVLLGVCIFLLSLPSGLHAQALSGITGTVTDESGAVILDAKVTVTNTATGVANTTTTTSAGTFTLTDLNPGSYSVKIDKPGFQTWLNKEINVEAGGKQASVEAVLKTGVATETIQVVGQSITLETSQPDLGTVVESKLIEELPIIMGSNSGAGGRGRQIDNFLFLAPGVQGGNFEHRINGGVSFQNEVVFNGIDANQSETQGFQSNINPPYEMVSEFRLLSTVFSAQYGLAQGVAYYQFASGTNKLHGDVFEIMRNDYFDARGAVNPTVPVDKEHNFGFTLGGPVFIPKVYHGKNKTFFHVSSEWYRLNQGIVATMTVPTPAMKTGDFSALIDSKGNPIPIFVPGKITAACQSALPTGIGPGSQFPGNKIPQGCVSAISTGLIPLIPDPDIKGLTGGAVFTNNKQSQLSNLPTRQTSWGFSIDHDLTDKQKLHGSFWRDTYNTPAFDGGASPFSNALSGLKNEPRIGTGLFLTYSKVFSSNLVMTAGMGWMGEINDEQNAHEGFRFPGAEKSEILPTISFGGSAPDAPSQWGVNGNGETFSINRKLGISLDNNWLWTHGRHSLNIGIEVRRSYQDDHECQQCGGNLSYSSLMTSNGDQTPTDKLNVNNTGNAFASFLLGEPNSAFRQFALETKLRNLYFAPYVQDNIKVSSRLTVDVGVRWDILKPFTVDSVVGQPPKTIVFFDPKIPNPGAVGNTTGQPLLGAANLLGNCSGCSGYNSANTRWRNFSPRIGLAYKLNSRTVILSGFALNHLDTGAYEYGNNKVAVNYGSLLAGIFNVNGSSTTTPGYCAPPFGNGPLNSDCTWDSVPLPAPQAGGFSSTLANGTGVLHQFGRDPGPIGYVQQWNAGVQRELGLNTLLTVSYVANRAVHLPSMMNPINQLNPNFLTQFCPDASGHGDDPNCSLQAHWDSVNGQAALAAAGFAKDPNGLFSPYANFSKDYPSGTVFQALLPYPMFNQSNSCGGLCNNFDMNGSSSYNALQVQAEKRFQGGLAFLVAYTLSRTMSNTDSGFSTFNFGSLNRFNQKSEWSIASNDQTHLLRISPVYELPIGPGKKFLNKGGLVAKNLIGGWQVSGVFQYASGPPLSIGTNENPLGNGFNRANLVAGQAFNVNWNNYYKGLPQFNTAAFSDPGFAPGNSLRNISGLRFPTFGEEDIGLAKKFFFGERVTAELRMEFYNVLNRMMVCVGDTNASNGNANFGKVNGGGTGFSPCQANSPRRGQAYFKVSF